MIGEDQLTVYHDGERVYDDMLTAIRSARHEILLDSFIWKADRVGREFKSAVADAAERGVRVRVIFDGFANLVVPAEFKDFPDSVEVLQYPALPSGWGLLDPRRYGRDHRKLLVVDAAVGFVGGYNVGELFAEHWRDTHVRVDGPGSWHLRRAFVQFWNSHRGSDLSELDPLEGSTWDPRIRLRANLPEERRFPIRDMYLSAIDQARSHIYVGHAYFIPDDDVRRALVAAARRGVDVQVLTARTSNHPVMDWLGQGGYGDLLDEGVRIWRYDRGMIHQKVATIDGQWSTVGTANLDRVSLVGNYELNLEVYDPGFAGHLEDAFATDQTAAVEVTANSWESRPAVAKAVERLVAPLRPLL